MKISCEDRYIGGKESVTQFGYLGVDLAQTISAKYMDRRVIHMSSSRLKFLFMNSLNCFSLVTALLVQSHFNYACSS